jgi:cell wall assembly regulator SMI1
MSEQGDLKSKIDTLHGKLNEFYALDRSWREVGKWPDDVNGSVLHPGASDDEIARAEAQFGHRFPPSYRECVKLHSAWEHFWGDFTLIGTAPPATQKPLEEIAENIEYQTSKLKNKFGDNFSPAAISTWESEEPRNLYLANHLVIATNFRGFHWVFDTRTRRANDEMKLVYWNISYGAQEPTFERFQDFLDWAIGEVDFRLEHLKPKARRVTKQKAAPSNVKAERTTKRSPRRRSP